MKLKGVSLIEQHFEKILAAVCVVFLGVAAWMFLLGSPHRVQFDGQLRAPDEIDAQIAKRALELKNMAESGDPPPWSDQKMEAVSLKFQDKVRSPMLSEEQAKLQWSLGMQARMGVTGAVTSDEKIPFLEPTFPDPKMFAWGARIASLAPSEYARYQVENKNDYDVVFSADQVQEETFDTPYVSIMASWDTYAVLDELTRESKNEDTERRVPPARISQFGVMDVQVQRQSPRPDGSWAAEGDADFDTYSQMLIPAPPLTLRNNMPGQEPEVRYKPSLLKDVVDADSDPDAGADAGRVVNLVAHELNRRLIVQPPFPAQRHENWEPPQSDAEIDQARKNLIRKGEIEADFAGRQKKLDSALKGLEKTKIEEVKTDRQRTDKQKKIDSQTQKIQEMINSPDVAKLQQEYARITGGLLIELTNAGVKITEPGGRGAAIPPPGTEPSAGEQRKLDFQIIQSRAEAIQVTNPLFDEPELMIHYHDLTVDEGETYRYRLRLRVLNPLYNEPTLPDGQVKKHKSQFLITTGWTDWTKPIEAPELTHYFVRQGTLSPSRNMDAEVWKYHKGLWYNKLFKNVNPGSSVGARETANIWDPATRRFAPTRVDFNTGSTLLDVVEVLKITGVNEKPDPRVLILEGVSRIVHRYETTDEKSTLLADLQKEKERLERVAGVPAAEVADRP